MRKHFKTFMTAIISMLSIMALCVGLAACGGDVSVQSVSLNKTELTLKVDDTETLVATIAPENATNKNVEWDSSNQAAATVDQSGKVTAVAEGTATITVKTKDGGKTATCEVTVTEKVSPVAVTGVSLNKNSLTLEVDGEETLIATVAPDNATNKNVTWSSSKKAIAEVDEEGKVTAVAEGTATITVKTEDGGFEAECEVTVTEKKSETIPVTGVTLDKDSLELVFGRTDKVDSEETLTATVAPAEASNKNVTWSSSAEAVATVDQSGKVTAVGVGTANITVTTEDGNHTASCIVIVRAPDHELTYVSNGAEGHHQECSVCGYTTDVSEHTTHLVSDGESGHHAECMANGCDYKTENVESHTLELTSDGATGSSHYRACDCGYKEAQSHRFTKTANDDSHWEYCPECSWEGLKTSHTKEICFNGNEHWYVCTGKYAGSSDVCGWQSEPEAHDGTEYSVKEDDSDHHYAKCATCEELYGEALEHTPGLNGMCTACGAEAGEHVHSYSCDENGYYEGLCSVCQESLFDIDSDGKITKYNGDFTKIKVPNKIGTIDVVAIDAPTSGLFRANVSIVGVIIPDSVITLASSVFNGCTNLETVVLGSGVSAVPSNAFRSCSNLSNLIFKGKITSVAASVFNGCTALKHVLFAMSAAELATLTSDTTNFKTSNNGELLNHLNDRVYYYSVNNTSEDESSKFAGAWHYDSQGVPTLWELTADLSAQTFVMMNNEKQKIYKGETI